MLSQNETIVLVNFNIYLGGGETLLVRFASFLERHNIDFNVLCQTNSFIEKELSKKNKIKDKFISLDIDPNYYYLNRFKRKQLVEKILHRLDKDKVYRFVTFCLRDLYTTFSLSEYFNKFSITHLILHPEDDLYVGQTIIDKIRYKFLGKREFNSKNTINFNHHLIRKLDLNNGLISMTEIITSIWNNRLNIVMDDNYIVPLPSFTKPQTDIPVQKFSKTIIWIGRIVDFKIPSLIAMIHFVNESGYHLTIVGKGNISEIKRYIEVNKLNEECFTFLGEVEYKDLPEVISEHSIGYAMGTSLIELAKFKIPVIVALASFDHKKFKRQICGGIFFNKYKGCDGTDLLYKKEEEINTTIRSTISEIESNYQFIAESCYKYAESEFNEETNFTRYLKIIHKTKFLTNDDKNVSIPEASAVRKLAYKYFKND